MLWISRPLTLNLFHPPTSNNDEQVVFTYKSNYFWLLLDSSCQKDNGTVGELCRRISRCEVKLPHLWSVNPTWFYPLIVSCLDSIVSLPVKISLRRISRLTWEKWKQFSCHWSLLQKLSLNSKLWISFLQMRYCSLENLLIIHISLGLKKRKEAE